MDKVKLGDIAVLINGDRGKNYPSQADITDEGEVPFVNAGHLNGRSIDFEDMNYISKEKYDRLSSGKFEKGDILYCLRGSLGKKAIVNDDVAGAIASSLVIIRPDYEKIDGDYLMFSLDSPSIKEQLVKANNGSSQPNLSAASVREYQIELPSIDIQKEVVEKLAKVRNVIDERQMELNLLDNLIKARFVEMFGDYHTNSKGFECHSGTELFKFSSGKFLPEEKRLEEGIPVYGGNGIAWYTDDALIDYPTIIIGRVGAWCGNIHTVTGPVWITDNAIFIKEQKTDKFTLEFLSELMKVMDFHQYADFSGQPKITQKPLESLSYITPPVNMQNEFTDFVKQVDKSKITVQKSLDETQKLFDSLMQEYFG